MKPVGVANDSEQLTITEGSPPDSLNRWSHQISRTSLEINRDIKETVAPEDEIMPLATLPPSICVCFGSRPQSRTEYGHRELGPSVYPAWSLPIWLLPRSSLQPPVSSLYKWPSQELIRGGEGRPWKSRQKTKTGAKQEVSEGHF